MTHNYLFDVKLFATVRIDASTQAEAENHLRRLLDCATCNAGELPDGSPLIIDISIDGDLDLVETDGEPQ